MALLNKDLLDDDIEVLALVGCYDGEKTKEHYRQKSKIIADVKRKSMVITFSLLLVYILSLFVFSNIWLALALVFFPLMVFPLKSFLFSEYFREARRKITSIMPEYSNEYAKCLNEVFRDPLLQDKFDDPKRKIDLIKGLYLECVNETKEERLRIEEKIDSVIAKENINQKSQK